MKVIQSILSGWESNVDIFGVISSSGTRSLRHEPLLYAPKTSLVVVERDRLLANKNDPLIDAIMGEDLKKSPVHYNFH